MKFSYNWIAEMVEGLDVTARDLGRLITMKTAECEGVESVGAHLEVVCAARVLTAEPTGAGHNVKAAADTGKYGTKTVVCGAPNCKPGMVTAYVPAGTVLGSREIRKLAVDGVESDGMLASGAELGLNRDAEGILEIDAEPGAAIPGCKPDAIFEIDNKSITHRPDLWGHHGLAREVAAITGREVLDPVDLALIPGGESPLRVDIRDFRLCPRYSGLLFENVRVGPSPLWLQYRLESIGLNSINNIVDVTNFVMAELAQPLHAFDADKLRSHRIIIRTAQEGETCQALNGETYTLDSSNLVIADEGGAVAIAGVIGGMGSAISETTRRIVLESANFLGPNVRRTSSKIKLRTDASMRFEKCQDPVNTARGIARAIALFREVCPGIRIVGGLADCSRMPAAAPPIELPMDWLEWKMGRTIAGEEVADILRRLEFRVEETRPRVLMVSAPSWRATKDITIKDDLVEEVGRMVGYDSIVPRAPAVPAVPPVPNEERLFERRIRSMVSAQGFTEVYNYSFVSEEQVREFGFDAEAHVRVANPISSDRGLMRMSLIPNIVRNIRDNLRHFSEFRLFEIGYEIHRREDTLPDEVPHLAAALCAKDDGLAGLLELKRLALCLLPGCEVRPAAARSFEHPARAAEVHWQGAAVGRLFEVHPSMVESARAAILDMNLHEMQSRQPRIGLYQPLRRYPTSAFDLSVVCVLRELAGGLETKLRHLAGESLVSIGFLRQYSGPPLAEGHKSVSYRLTVGAADRTLSSEEVNAIRARIIQGMERLGYELRA